MSVEKPAGIQFLMLLGIGACCLFIGQVFAQLLVLSIYGDGWREITSYPHMLQLLRMGVIHAFTYMGTFFVFMRINQQDASTLFDGKIKSIYWLFILPAVVAGIYLSSWLALFSLSFFESIQLFDVLDLHNQQQEAMYDLLIHNNIAQFIVSLIVLAVLPAIGEEFIFRGLIQRIILNSTHRIHFSVIISALIFSAMHAQPVNLLSIFVLGIGLGYVYTYTKNIGYSMLIHFLINGIQLSQLFFWPEIFS